ncbi:MAG: hypothetical protein R3237_05040 [Nitrosopumilaceae archaeon]|nr:hypothetical protein [Nitrosopumilaceae archaeon]
MTFHSAQCQLCESPKTVTAEDKHWLIHLTGHKDDIIRFMTNRFSNCPLCLERKFTNKIEEEDHFRWFHTNKAIIEWYFEKFIQKSNEKPIVDLPKAV